MNSGPARLVRRHPVAVIMLSGHATISRDGWKDAHGPSRAEREPGGPATIVFNGDFHWLDTDPGDFQAISETVLAHHAIKGNVEAELASDEDAGCGCAYPDYVDDAVVDRSTRS